MKDRADEVENRKGKLERNRNCGVVEVLVDRLCASADNFVKRQAQRLADTLYETVCVSLSLISLT